MPQIIPFQGFLYNQGKVNLQDVVAPPYDVISPEQQEKLYARSPFNVVRLILGKEEDRYTSAARHLEEWTRNSVLVRDPEPSIYFIAQTFTGKDGKSYTRRGLVVLCRLEEFEKKVILPHERTLAKPREDRLKLFRATNSNFSQIFSLYSDPERTVERLLNGVTQSLPAIQVMFEDVQNRLWRFTDTDQIRAIQDLMREKQLLIADGHHRYETALAYRDLKRKENPGHTGAELYNYVMMFLTNIDDEGLVVYPTHRLVHSLPGLRAGDFLQQLGQYFVHREFKNVDMLVKGLSSSPVKSLGLVTSGDPCCYLLTLKPSVSSADLIPGPVPPEVKDLDVSLLHEFILKELLGISREDQEQKRYIDYVKDLDQAFDAVRLRTAQLAFLMNPTRVDQVRAVARAGYTMPQKSTYFFPKLLTGLVLHRMS